jgi:hypothetical protein
VVLLKVMCLDQSIKTVNFVSTFFADFSTKKVLFIEEICLEWERHFSKAIKLMICHKCEEMQQLTFRWKNQQEILFS